jgi:hypothetical protein
MRIRNPATGSYFFLILINKILIRIEVKSWIRMRILNPGSKYLNRLDPDPQHRPLLFLILLILSL